MNKKEEFPADSPEKRKQFRMEQARGILSQLRRIHDIFDDRSIMADPEVADFVASQFTSAGVETLVDFIEDLKKAKERQADKK